jgi:hypothetical protein
LGVGLTTHRKKIILLRNIAKGRGLGTRVLRRIFGPENDEEIGWRKLRNEEFHNLYSSPRIIKVIKSMRMRGAGHVARMA